MNVLIQTKTQIQRLGAVTRGEGRAKWVKGFICIVLSGN